MRLGVVVGARRGVMAAGGTHHLQLVLPELLLPGLVEERKLADMVDEDVAQDGEFGVERRDLAEFGFEGGAKAAQGGWGVEL